MFSPSRFQMNEKYEINPPNLLTYTIKKKTVLKKLLNVPEKILSNNYNNNENIAKTSVSFH